MLGSHQYSTTPFTTDRNALAKAQNDKQDRCKNTNRLIGRQDSNEECSSPHDHDGQHQHLLASDAVTKVTKDNATERSAEEADPEDQEGGQLTRNGRQRGKKELVED